MSHTYVHFFYVKTIIDVLYGLDTKKKKCIVHGLRTIAEIRSEAV